jgi:hypothetical protein
MKSAFRWVTFFSGVIATGVATFGAALPAWIGPLGAFLSGAAVNAERIFGSDKNGR